LLNVFQHLEETDSSLCLGLFSFTKLSVGNTYTTLS
jgi:hypothetical protein